MTEPSPPTPEAEAVRGHDVLRRSADTLWRRLLGGVLLLAPDMDEPLRLSQPADVLWELLAEAIPFDALVAVLAEAHDVPADVVRNDLTPLVERLLAAGAIVVVRQ